MPIYEFVCGTCQVRREEKMTLPERRDEEARAARGEGAVFCGSCGGPMSYAFSPTAVAALQGFGWASRDHVEAVARERRSAQMADRQRTHRRSSRLVPNLGGRLADRWSDVRDEVRDKKGSEAASTFDGHVAAEAVSP